MTQHIIRLCKSLQQCQSPKMTAKLIVHKFETDFDFKALQITFEDENDYSEIKFSEWLDGKSFQRKDKSQKSRLVVKIISEDEACNFDLDSCADIIKDNDMNIASKIHKIDIEKSQINETQSANETNNKYKTKTVDAAENEHFVSHKECSLVDNREVQNNISSSKNIDCLHDITPLEYSLEKVMKNNARIMKNIHMLNRTLSYTKQKELENGCSKPMRSFPCESCGQCFVYETGLRRHYAMRHTALVSHPNWQIVWTCAECFQVWPQYEIALAHSRDCCHSEYTDCVHEIKTSSLLQCEYCEKVFTSIPRLLRHSMTHSTLRNYECNTCKITFQSYKAAEEHWLLCPWLTKYYTFSLQKLLLCNACDRKFRSYDQLYSHRYKVGHFMAKLNGSLGYNYQCETCGDSFPTTTSLQEHRSKCHPYQNITYQNFFNQYN